MTSAPGVDYYVNTTPKYLYKTTNMIVNMKIIFMQTLFVCDHKVESS